ncbi:MAG TPA: fused MFS/spermidine synthase [Polyangiaceae bacterium]|nr:fused MFS/spermidine synthase [Polyangiaceae bacterium]
MRRLWVLGAIFFASGASALVFETLWFRQAGLGLGNGIVASSLVLSAFMAGLALGGLFAARWLRRFRRPLLSYAALELAVAVSGPLLVVLLPDIGALFAPLARVFEHAPAVLHALRFSFAFVLLLVPSTALGMTLPVLVSAGTSAMPNFGSVLGFLYGINTLGAVVGVVGTETFLLESCGIRGSAFIAGAVDLAAAGAVIVVSRRDARQSKEAASSQSSGTLLPGQREASSQPSPVPIASPVLSVKRWPLYVAGFGSGMLLLGLEVVWLRFLMLFLNETPLIFAVVLALVLTGIAAGGFVGAWMARKNWASSTEASWVAYGAGILGVAAYRAFPHFAEGTLTPYQSAGTMARFAAVLVVPTAVASGVVFTLIGAALRRVSTSDVATAGRLLFYNTIGAALGSLLGGLALLPTIGMERSLFALLAAYGVVGLVLAFGGAAFERARLIAPALFALGCFGFPFGAMQRDYIRTSAARWQLPSDVLESVREGQTATLIHVVHRIHGKARFDHVATNAYSMTMNGFSGRRYMKLFAVLPLAVHPHVERALVVGYGIGNTAQTLTDTPELRAIDVVDVSTDMLEMSRRLVTRVGADPLADPRVRVHIEDARFFLRSTNERYDLITGEPPPPIMAGVVSLYTSEYFQLVYGRLRDGGMATYWLPMMNLSASSGKAIVRAFCDAFADCSLWRGTADNFMLLGTRNARGPVSDARFVAQWEDPKVSRELAAIGFEAPSQLGALFVGDADYLNALTSDTPPLVDDWPKRLGPPTDATESEALLAEWHDTRSSRSRFQDSRLVASLFPESLRRASLGEFEGQRLLDDLLSSSPTVARTTRVLHAVLHGVPHRLAPLLLLGSDPDVQRVLAQLTPAERTAPEWLPHVVAAELADRDLAGALATLERTPDDLLAMPDLRAYVRYAATRQEHADHRD